MNLTDFKRYNELESEDVSSITSNGLPNEFSKEAFKTVNEFIKKTKNLEYECTIYFDYISGEILKCAIGDDEGVSLIFEEGEFENNHVASIHNHPSKVYSPPSDKNFDILMRDFEDYELIAGQTGLWILKAKCTSPNMNIDLKLSALYLLDSCQEYCQNLYSDNEKADEVCDIMYGVMLSNYINDKNINDIQLVKREYEYD